MSHFENSLHTFKECGLECTGHITSSEFQFAFVSDFTSIFLAMTGYKKQQCAIPTILVGS
jgi:hypothetical protein